MRRLGDPDGIRPLRPLALLPTEGDLRHGRHGVLPRRIRPHHGMHDTQVRENYCSEVYQNLRLVHHDSFNP